MDYLDFDIAVEAGTSGTYQVSVVQSPAGEAHGEMTFPYDRLALKNKIQALQIALLRSGGSRRAGPSAEDKSVEELGSDLFASLFKGEIGSRLDVSRSIAQNDGKGVRIKAAHRGTGAGRLAVGIPVRRGGRRLSRSRNLDPRHSVPADRASRSSRSRSRHHSASSP